MIDTFALLLIHGLLAIAGLRLLRRDDLDRELDGGEPRPSAPAGRDSAG